MQERRAQKRARSPVTPLFSEPPFWQIHAPLKCYIVREKCLQLSLALIYRKAREDQEIVDIESHPRMSWALDVIATPDAGPWEQTKASQSGTPPSSHSSTSQDVQTSWSNWLRSDFYQQKNEGRNRTTDSQDMNRNSMCDLVFMSVPSD